MINKAVSLYGTVKIPGDKSISHRSLMLSSLANSPVVIKNFLFSADCLATANCLRALGSRIETDAEGNVRVQGRGLNGLREPEDVLDAQNSGTTMRLMTGILAAQPFFSILTGDESLKKRPMGRVIEPLRQMGAKIVGRQQSRFAPLAILPGKELTGLEYQLPVASAQVKSALLLAHLCARKPGTVYEPYRSRDHTERMFKAFAVPVAVSETAVAIQPVGELKAPPAINIPGDISSAAYWLIAASIIPHSELTLKDVGMNPTRTGIIDVLRKMGADLTIINERGNGEEPVADIVVKSASLQAADIGPEIMPRLIDEIPIITVAALFAEGRTTISGAAELRVKESDRLQAVVAELTKMGAKITETADGLILTGPQKLNFAECRSHNDHRMAMSLAVAGMAANGVAIDQAGCVAISYPDFFAALDLLVKRQ